MGNTTDLNSYQKNQIIQINNQYHYIHDIDEKNQTLSLLNRTTGELNTFDINRNHAQSIQLFEEKNIKISVGTKLRLDKTHKELGRTLNDSFLVSAINDKSITLKNNDQTIHVDPHHYIEDRHINYDYARTTYGSQGASFNYVIAYQGTQSHNKVLLNPRSFYVDISRAKLHTQVYTENKKELMNQIKSYEADKTALDLLEPIKKNQQKIIENSKNKPSEKTINAKKITYLYVPFAAKEEAKNLGAKWDQEKKQWFITEKQDSKLFQQWLEKPMTSMQSISQSFETACINLGLKPKQMIMDGKLHRVSVEGDKRGQKSGAYIGFLDSGKPSGFIQNWKTGESTKWGIKQNNYNHSDQEKITERIQERNKEQEKLHLATAQKAQYLLDKAKPADHNHPYLKAKGITENCNLKQDQYGNLIIPARDTKGKLWTTQLINDKGEKRFLKGGEKSGHFYTIGTIPKQPNTLYITEGLATGHTVHQATNSPTIVAFDSGNLKAVVNELAKQYPNTQLIIAADNDQTNKVNTGIQKAIEATQSVNNATYIVPPISKQDAQNGATDFNDLAKLRGIEAVKNTLSIPQNTTTNKQNTDYKTVIKNEQTIIHNINKEQPNHSLEKELIR